MILSDRDIRAELAAGRIVIDPFDPDAVQPSSVDLHLDHRFRVFRNSRYPFIDVREEQPGLTELVEIEGDEPFVLHPGEFVLGSTFERVALPDDLVARLEGKSSLGRLGLLIHSTAGYVDPGWDGNLTLELSNVANLPISLYDGMKIGQISFQRLSSPVERAYGDPRLWAHATAARPIPRPAATSPTSSGDASGAAGDRVTEPLYAITPPSEARVFAGGVRVRIVRAGWFRPDAGGFFGVVPQALWTRFAQTDERGRILCRLNLLLVEAGGKRILVETGTGVGMSDKNRDIKGVEGGDPTEALRAVGEDPAAWTSWWSATCTTTTPGAWSAATAGPAFPKARYVVQRDEAQAAHGDELRLTGIMEREQLDAVQAAGQLAEVSRRGGAGARA